PNGREVNLAAVEELLLRVGRIVGKERTYLGSFPSEVRPEMVSEEAIALIKRLAGNRNITVGAQSGSERILRAMHRGHTVGDVYRACEIILRHGLVPNVDVIFGLPGETAEDRRQTIRLIEDLTSKGARVRTHAFIPLAGTPLATAPPGEIDEETDRLLGTLARLGQQHGARRSRSSRAHHSSQG
ncbi:MAG: radical SAM protein, partial [Anaerolineae bacterium]|nr:radical SAM protein [Anaerolineae bacterium]